MPQSPGKAFPRTATIRAGDKQEPGQAFQLSGQELSSARSCFKASSPDLTGNAAPCLVFSRGEKWVQESSLLGPCSHAADQELPARNKLQGDAISLNCLSFLSELSLALTVPEALPAECSVMSPLQAGKHRAAPSTSGS